MQMNYWEQRVKLEDTQFEKLRSTADGDIAFRTVFNDASLALILPAMAAPLYEKARASHEEDLKAWTAKKAAFDQHEAAKAARVAAAAAAAAAARDVAFRDAAATRAVAAAAARDAATNAEPRVPRAPPRPVKDAAREKQDMEAVVSNALDRLLPAAFDAQMRRVGKAKYELKQACVKVMTTGRDLKDIVTEATSTRGNKWTQDIKDRIVLATENLNIFSDEMRSKWHAVFHQDNPDGFLEQQDPVVIVDSDEEHNGETFNSAPAAGGLTVSVTGGILGALPESATAHPPASAAGGLTADPPAPATGVLPGTLTGVVTEGLLGTATEHAPATAAGGLTAAGTGVTTAVPVQALPDNPVPALPTGVVTGAMTPTDIPSGGRPRTRLNPGGGANGREPSPNPPVSAAQVVIDMSYVQTQEGSQWDLSQIPNWSQLESQADGSQAPTPIALHASMEQRDTRAASRAAFNSLHATQPQPSPTY